MLARPSGDEPWPTAPSALLAHERSQASVLVQIGLLDAKLLPVAGVEAARKLLGETLPSNTLMRR